MEDYQICVRFRSSFNRLHTFLFLPVFCKQVLEILLAADIAVVNLQTNIFPVDLFTRASVTTWSLTRMNTKKPEQVFLKILIHFVREGFALSGFSQSSGYTLWLAS